MEQQRNLFLAIALSIAILLGFQIFFEQPRIQKQQALQQAQQAQQAQTAPQAPAAPGAPPPSIVPGTPSPAAAPPAPVQTPRLKIKTPRVEGSIALTGARLDDLKLVNYRETVDPKSKEIVLLSPAGTAHPYVVEFGWVPKVAETKVPGHDTLWTASAGALTPDAPVTLTWDNGEGLRFTRTIAVDRNYLFTVTQKVENRGSAPVTLLPYGLIQRTGTPVTEGFYILHEGPIAIWDGKLKEVGYGDLQGEKPREQDTTGGWLGITDKYWLTALIPDQKERVHGRLGHAMREQKDLYHTDYLGAEREVAPGASVETTARLFAGAKEVNLLERYEKELGVERFADAVDWGWFFFLTKPIFHVLDFFHRQIGNFGLGILVLTVIIKIIFFPLANKSYAAMSKMKDLQPKMLELREKHGDDKARLNQEMMALYKRAGANPLAGCLPIIIQIPVFFALYKVLFVTIEMRHAPFYGWIRDLSAPDPTTMFNLFGLIPWDPPSLLHVGAWPIIMGVTMFLQQKLNPQPPDPIQAKMFMLLPFIFTYMLAQFAAGLVIYWAWNNLLSIAQQWAIMRRHHKAV
jgi:YidC/Oxa1 family membrane protein insertase